jgi:probable HAF family extracellular repeat protein
VVGNSFSPTFVSHAFLWQSGTMMRDLGTLGGSSASAYGINAACQVVGQSLTSFGSYHAFLWQNGTMTDLNTLIPPASGWTVQYAQALTISAR